VRIPVAVASLIVATTLSAQSVTLTTPGVEPALFAPGVVSTMFAEWNTTFTADGRTVFFSRGQFWTIMTSTRGRSPWSAPEVAPFSGRWMDTDPFVSPDGRRVYFVSNRPLDGNPATPPRSDFGIWYVERTPTGGWSPPISVGATVNDHGSAWFPSVTRDGTLYFHARRPGGAGSSDIYCTRWLGDHYADAVPVEFNTAASEQEPYVSPDETYMIFVSDRAGGLGAGDLYLSLRRNGHWGAPMHIDQPVNSYANDMAPSMSPDGAMLYFTSNRRPYHGVRPARVDAAAFRRELESYGNGDLKMYSIPLDTVRLHALLRESAGP
jgi:Tol biopolymer transport system component